MDDNIAETDVNIMRLTQSSNKWAYAEALWNNEPEFDKEYDKYVLERVCIGGLQESVRRSFLPLGVKGKLYSPHFDPTWEGMIKTENSSANY